MSRTSKVNNRKKKCLAALLAFSMLWMAGCAAQPNTAEAPGEDAGSAERSEAEALADAAPGGEYDDWEEGAAQTEAEDIDWSGAGESYLTIDENREVATGSESMLTFSLKVDTAAYTNVARYIESGNLPPRDAVRTEELINYFRYEEPVGEYDGPFAVYTEVGPSPFRDDRYLAMIRVRTEEIEKENLPSSNLTFLIDTSGSMNTYDKLPLLKEAFSLLVETLDEDDVVSIVTYAGSSEIALDSVSGADKSTILSAINNLQAGGSTAGANGIQTAYALAEKNLMAGGNNRIILATDGDFNVGVSSVEALEELVAAKRDNGVYLSVLGFGTGNIREDVMETLSKHGNGNYSYINTSATAQKVLVEELGSNLFTVADDVKAQVEFHPGNVASYRLIGYENRMLANRDFADDTKDAGEVGAGTDVVVLFELELRDGMDAEALKYAVETESAGGEYADELFEVRIRYKDPGEGESKLLVRPVPVERISEKTTDDFRFAASVAMFGHLLRDSEYSGNATMEGVLSMAKDSLGDDAGGYRLDHLLLLREYQNLAG